MAMAVALLFLLLATPAVVYAAQHTVGDSTGWTTGQNYVTWASAQTFLVGDTLVFNYGSTHAVDEVTSTDYANCATSNAIKSYNSSPTTILLNSTGPLYFFCPTAGHCLQGMRLSINVVASNTNGTTSSPPPPPPPPPPPHSGATSNLCAMNRLNARTFPPLGCCICIYGLGKRQCYCSSSCCFTNNTSSCL
ncbi:hypothetical protein L1049_018643 [Liquidambar formosana]|uniref:Phytocyanin domain-containing protein n=1 Tax=Liquidambar formosana TaxID=63359 RepID=A0AAP0WLZ9_LIQFO